MNRKSFHRKISLKSLIEQNHYILVGFGNIFNDFPAKRFWQGRMNDPKGDGCGEIG